MGQCLFISQFLRTTQRPFNSLRPCYFFGYKHLNFSLSQQLVYSEMVITKHFTFKIQQKLKELQLLILLLFRLFAAYIVVCTLYYFPIFIVTQFLSIIYFTNSVSPFSLIISIPNFRLVRVINCPNLIISGL